MRSANIRKLKKFIRFDEHLQIEEVHGIDPSLCSLFREWVEYDIDNDLNTMISQVERQALTYGLIHQKGLFEGYRVPGSAKSLIVVHDQPGTNRVRDYYQTHFPFEHPLDYTVSPQSVIDMIVERVKQIVSFERFDVLRIFRSLHRYNFEYSIGLNIEEVIHAAYSEITNSGLAWVYNKEKPHLVEAFTPKDFCFREDPPLYQTGFRSVMRVPIVFNQGTIGGMMFAAVKPEQFQLEHVYLLESLGYAIGQAFFHAGILQDQEYQTLATSSLLQAIAKQIRKDENPQFIQLYCETLRQISNTERVALFLVDEEEGKYCCLAETKPIVGVGKWEPLSRNEAMSHMLKLKGIVSFNLADTRYRAVDELLDQGFTSILYAPIFDSQGRIQGCFGLASVDERAMTKEVAGLFKVASEHLGFILSQSRFVKEPSGQGAGSRPKVNGSQEERPHAKRIEVSGFEEIIGSSEVIQEAIQKAATAAQYEFPILLSGETGTGKELFAKAIHRSSPAAKGPFIVVNSAAIPENLLESELFGYKEGVFTGGVKGGKKGKILLANGGTLFLDEIGELSLDLQAKLLRVIQEKEVEPLGAEKPIPVKVRIVSATHRNLKEMVERGEFREDLYYRLNSIELRIPSLKERGEDVIELAENFLENLAQRSGKQRKLLADEVKQILLDYDWPGNVRQLQNVINWAFVFDDDDHINVEDLPIEIRSTIQTKESEKEQLIRLLNEFNGNKTAVANYLGISRTGLWKKLKRLGLQ